VARHVLLTQRAYGRGVNLPPQAYLNFPMRWKRNSNGYSPFSTTAIPTDLMGILPDATGSGKSKMAVYKLVLSIYRLVDKIERRFQRKILYLRCPVTQEKNSDNLNQTGSRKSNMAASKPEILKSLLVDKIETKFRRLDLHFRGPAFEWD